MTDTPSDQKLMLPRLLAGAVALLFTYYVAWGVNDAVTSPTPDLFYGILIVTAGTVAAMCWWFALRGHIHESRAVMGMGWLGGFVVGGLAFVAGFLLPIIFMPDANQGPLFGIFISGPLGFVAGTAGGVIVGKLRRA